MRCSVSAPPRRARPASPFPETIITVSCLVSCPPPPRARRPAPRMATCPLATLAPPFVSPTRLGALHRTLAMFPHLAAAGGRALAPPTAQDECAGQAEAGHQHHLRLTRCVLSRVTRFLETFHCMGTFEDIPSWELSIGINWIIWIFTGEFSKFSGLVLAGGQRSALFHQSLRCILACQASYRKLPSSVSNNVTNALV